MPRYIVSTEDGKVRVRTEDQSESIPLHATRVDHVSADSPFGAEATYRSRYGLIEPEPLYPPTEPPDDRAPSPFEPEYIAAVLCQGPPEDPLDRVQGLVRRALMELGVPDQHYPAPVANAIALLLEAAS